MFPRKDALEKRALSHSVHTQSHTRTRRSATDDGHPPQGLSEARREERFFYFFFELFVTDPPRGRPIGGGGIHRLIDNGVTIFAPSAE